MQYSPKLKKAAEEIKAILKRYDIAAHVVLHTPGHSEYLMEISPTYSCAKLIHGGVHFKAKKEDFGGIAEYRDQCIADTANMLNLLTETGGQNILALCSVADQLDKLIDADHGASSHTSHDTQNN